MSVEFLGLDAPGRAGGSRRLRTLFRRRPISEDGNVLLDGSLPERGLREVVAARTQLDALEMALVIEARRQWATWTEIESLLGLTKQAAWVRYRAVDPLPPRRPRQPMRPCLSPSVVVDQGAGR